MIIWLNEAYHSRYYPAVYWFNMPVMEMIHQYQCLIIIKAKVILTSITHLTAVLFQGNVSTYYKVDETFYILKRNGGVEFPSVTFWGLSIFVTPKTQSWTWFFLAKLLILLALQRPKSSWRSEEVLCSKHDVILVQ